MGTYILGNGSYRKAMRTRTKNLKKNMKVGLDLISSKMVLKAKTNAPRNSGKLASSIARRKTKNGYSVLAGYKGNEGFDVGGWTDQRFDIQPDLPGGRASRIFGVPPGTSFTYGSPIADVIWTARISPWWTKSAKAIEKEFGKKMVKQVRMAMRSA